ncbi:MULTISPECIES: type II secretion system F family protein [Streptomyces]|uniref:Secretion system protein n=2 Tax=Streptomyces TaxID=1883 RepID=A0A1E7LTH1_9ACTN|nr:type II secretion system F family protein [Streptomyces nanshensis]OEV19495.1 secretion system protein [Streptomyces nanshensis]
MTLTLTSLIAAFGGLAAVGGLVLAVAGGVGWAPSATVRRRSRLERKVRALFVKDARTPTSWWARGQTRMAGAALAGLGVWLFTGWLTGGLVTVAVVLGLPWLLNTSGSGKTQIDKLEAIEEWVRRMSDIHTVGVSLEATIQRSLETVPKAIREEVQLLVSRQQAGWVPQDAYRAFADDLNDAMVDEVVALLILHVEDRGSGLSKAMRELADALQHEVLARREVEADRQKPRTNDRWVTIFCLGIFGITAFSGTYVEPYNTLTGQLVLAFVAVAFVLVKIWMRRMAILEPAPRFLSPADRSGGQITEEAP